ncbi:oligosaccharide flippase family protein [Aeromicrobium alkaliterrae]|uniref:Oligosaccharide flippase family protein n=1 Tax=Aeromicrobium alkaliterrae TaxID=302168 RepID=A0ABP4W3R2_9ACTN
MLAEAAKGAGWLGLGAGVVKASQTLVLLILAAILAPSALGVLAIGALVLNVTSAITDLGSSTALVYWRGDVDRAARSALSVALGSSLVLTTAVWFVAPPLASVLNTGPDGASVIRGLMLCLPFLSVAGVSQELLRRDLAFKRRVFPDIISAIVGATVSVVLAASGLGVHSLVIGQLVQAVLVMLLCWAMRPPVVPGWRRSDVSGLVAYGGSLAGANIVQLLMLNVDYVIVAHQLGADALGVYSMAFRLAYMPFLVVGMVVAGAAFAFLCRLEGAAVGRAVGQVLVALSVIAIPLHLGMLLLAPQLTLLGEQWAPGVPVLRWLALYGLALTGLHLLITALNAVSRTRDGLLLNLLHLALLTGLLVTLTGRGVELVAVSQLVAVLLSAVVAGFVVRRRIDGIDVVRILVILRPVLLGAAAMTATALVAHALLPWSVVSVPGLLLVGVLMVAAYALPLWTSRRRFVSLVTELRSQP